MRVSQCLGLAAGLSLGSHWVISYLNYIKAVIQAIVPTKRLAAAAGGREQLAAKLAVVSTLTRDQRNMYSFQGANIECTVAAWCFCKPHAGHGMHSKS
eukprot:362104-Chlamydomonas_euryale.AAC.6